MSTENKHTFVILAYGDSPFLESCIQSVASQTVASRVCITTSTPNDHIHSLAAKYSIPVLVNPRGGNIGKDWNFGLSVVSTPFLTLTHQDDEYLPDFAERCIADLEKYAEKKPLIAFTPSQIMREGNVTTYNLKNLVRLSLILPFHFRSCICSRFWKRFILLFSNGISCPGVMYVRENLAGFEFDENSGYVLDWRAWAKLSEREGSFVYVHDAFHVHREHRESATANIDLALLQEEEKKLLVELWGNERIPKLIVKLLRFAK